MRGLNKAVLVLLVSVLVSGGIVAPNLPTVEEVDYVIEEIKYCMSIHQMYVEEDYMPKVTGGVEWHERWVDSYNRTLGVLYAYRHLIKMLRYEESFRTWR